MPTHQARALQISPPTGCRSNKALIVLILAGFGSIKGVLIGGFLLGAIEAVGVYVMGTPYREVFGLILFVLFLMFRPQGLAGKKA